jgi:hypothetical protein
VAGVGGRPAPPHRAMIRRALTAACLAMAVAPALASTDADLASRLAQMRTMTPASGTAAVAAQRRELDKLWRYFGDQREQALPVMRQALAAELRQTVPAPLLLLDVGYFLQMYGTAADKSLALQALLAVDAAAPIDKQQLFRFVHAAAQGGDARLLPLIERAFLRGSVAVYVPQHGFTVDEVAVCTYLYGQFGNAGEAHLRALLGDAAVVNKALDVLAAIGSPDSVPAVARLLASPDPETFGRATNVLLRAGGPQGRATLLALDAKALQGKVHELFQPLREQLEKNPAQAPAPTAGGLADDEVRRRLALVEQQYGRYDAIALTDIAHARLPKQELLASLTRIRARCLLRVSDEALADFDGTSALLNALRFRPD